MIKNLMGMAIPFSVIFLTPLAIWVLGILLVERPMLAVLFVLVSILVTFVIDGYFRFVNEGEVRRWRERNSKSAPPVYYFQFRLILASFGLVSAPFGVYCLLVLA